MNSISPVTNIYDCIVVGKGLIGSAAAKYLSLFYENVAAIGPDEPAGDLSQSVVFSSHYDSGRVQRIIGTDAVWTKINHESAKRYTAIAAESNIKFHSGVGCLYVTPDEKDTYIKQLPELAKKFDVHYNFFEDGNSLQKSFPEYVFPSQIKAMKESSPSGHINPRLLIKAQLSIFTKHSGSVINDTVNKMTHYNGDFYIKTISGKNFCTKKVLLAPGAFANFFGWLPGNLSFRLKGETVLLAKVSEEEAERLSDLPSLLYEIKSEKLDGIYLIRPVQYPDGNYYLKMGCNLAEDKFFTGLEDIQQWFRYGDSDSYIARQSAQLKKILPNISVEQYFTKRCIITRTKSTKPYIGKVNDDGLFVATGGNGYGAMCSDELGKIAAQVIKKGKIPAEYPPAVFNPVYD